MSFSGEVREELSRQISSARHCRIAELAAIMHYCGKVSIEAEKGFSIHMQTENLAVARKYFTLVKKTFNIETDIVSKYTENHKKTPSYAITVCDSKAVEQILKAVKIMDNDGNIHPQMEIVNSLVIKNACCRRAFIRGVYLAVGSMSDPKKGYHLEFVCESEALAEQLCAILDDFEIDAKIVLRKKYFVVYLKEGSGIVELLNVMEAHVALMNFENLRILKEMRNSINRRVNCEAANITKTVTAATKQREDIILIRDSYGLQNLPENLREMAEVRLEHPDATLKELGQCLEPPVGKSGVNHRLRKLSELAESVRT